MAQSGHRPTTLKQQNKKHNKLGHKSKGQVRALTQGRQCLQSISRKAKHELARHERRNQVNVVRSEKRAKVLSQKRKLGTDAQPPFLACVVMLSQDINPRAVLLALTGADSTAVVTNSSTGNTHVSCTRFKQRYTFVVPPMDDLYAILDTAKVCSTLLVVWPCCDRDEEVLGEEQQKLLSCIKAQGLPTPVHVTLGYKEMAMKRQTAALRNLLFEVRHYFPGEEKVNVHELDKPIDALMCLRQVGAQKQRSLFYRDHRPHILAEKIRYEEDKDSASTGTLLVTGYLRGVPLSVNNLVHIPGWGDYQLSKVVSHEQDPHPLVLNHNANVIESADIELFPDPEEQESTASIREVVSDESDDSGADDDGDEDLDSSDGSDDDSDASKSVKSLTSIPVRKAKIPGATSSYQAAWMIDNEAYDDDDSDYDDADSDERDEFDAPEAAVDDDSVCGGDDDDDDDDSMSVTSGSEFGTADDTYDEKIDYNDEMDEYERIRDCRDDLEFPDEIDTPRDVLARERFAKYRGLESFKTSPWDLNENLPDEYKKIFHIPKFNIFRKRVLAVEQDREGGIRPGQYVTLHIKNVEKYFYQDFVQSRSPLVVFGLMLHEQRMAVVNMVLKSHPVAHTRPIKSKDRLLFHVGFRRFENKPIFSEHTAGDKQKFCRYFHPGETVVASVYAPVTYPPASVLVFRQLSGGRQELVATGSVYSVDANRCILKRQILSGHPFKIHKRSAVIRYMFFDRDDIIWFRPIELRTKWGRKGKIKEALGTHGHMKCQFNRQLKSQDTILLNLYKRVFPKWTYNTCVDRPCPMYSQAIFEDDESEEDEEQAKKILMKRDALLMPPPSKKPKKVHFTS
uniref:Pre-rRNA-processing protein TSR1 homolog n=1 Tax=Hirondellea gigas TaxID=1518452 RepID=A0A2P2HX46_9CRUS